MSFLIALKKVLDRLLEVLVIVVMAVLVLDVLWQVFTRLILQEPQHVDRRVGGLHADLGFAAGGGRGARPRGASGHRLLRRQAARNGPGSRTEVIVFFCVAAFSFLVMILGGVDLVASNLELGQESPALRVKMGYVYLAVPISGFFLTLYAVIGLVERLKGLKSRPADSAGTGVSGVSLD